MYVCVWRVGGVVGPSPRTGRFDPFTVVSLTHILCHGRYVDEYLDDESTCKGYPIFAV